MLDGFAGTPQLLRSLTRDPGPADPAAVRPWTIFLETLIHDVDTLRFINPGAEVLEVCAVADALVRNDFRDGGRLDTSVVTLRFDNGAIEPPRRVSPPGTAMTCAESSSDRAEW